MAAPLVAGIPVLAAVGVSWAGSQALIRPAPGRVRTPVTVTPVEPDAGFGDCGRNLLAGWLPSCFTALPVTGLVRLDRPAPALVRVLTDEGATLVLGPDWRDDRAQAARDGAWDEVPRSFERVVLGAEPPTRVLRGSLDAYLFDTPAEAGLVGGPIDLAGIGQPSTGWIAEPADPGGQADPGVSASTFAVFVHGRRANAAQGLRLARAFATAGIPSLGAPYYAGDSPATRRSGLGGEEWPHVEAAVRHALAAGADRVVLAGASMGAAVVTSLLRHSEVAARVCGLVFDSPVLDWSTVVRAAARSRRLPAAVAAPVLALSAWRAGLEWADVSLLADPPREPLPTLVIHGSADVVTPLSSSQRLADLLPEHVALEVFEGAGHVQSYNTAPRRYEAVVAAFARGL